MRERWRAAAGAWMLAVAVGPVLGTLWWLVAPGQEFLVGPGGSVAAVSDPPADWFGYDAWFLLIGAALGLLVGLLAAWRWPDHPVSALLGLAVGLLVAAGLAWWLGGALGPDTLAEQLKGAKVGDRLAHPLGLRASGVLLAPAFFGVAAFAAVAAMRSPLPTPVIVAADEVAPADPFSPAGPTQPSSPA